MSSPLTILKLTSFRFTALDVLFRRNCSEEFWGEINKVNTSVSYKGSSRIQQGAKRASIRKGKPSEKGGCVRFYNVLFGLRDLEIPGVDFWYLEVVEHHCPQFFD
jgi:hypothetical protein